MNHALASFVPINPDGSAVYLTSLSNSAVLDGMGAILAYGKHKNEDQRYEFSTTFEAKFQCNEEPECPCKLQLPALYNYQTMNRTVNVPYSKYPGEISIDYRKRCESVEGNTDQSLVSGFSMFMVIICWILPTIR